MEKDKALQVIEAEIVSSTSNDLAQIIYEIIVEKELDKKAIRNKVIKAEFNELYKTSMPIMDIYSTISHTHNISERTALYIVAK
jgi:hypothetical protein